MPKLERFLLSRIVANQTAIDRANFAAALSFRVAPDEIYVQAELSPEDIEDAHAIITQDSSLVGVWLEPQDAHAFLERECAWEIPAERPVFVQGMVAHLPVKLYFEETRVLFLTTAPFGHDLELSLGGFLHE